ncbi:hypothetical protein [Spongiactinospora sp. TRM90649]|uniref:hypothetical protein n=1 Tax=Spongiactinospora sp. TRM90649 TaxID=3031114 RepID=UPI0023F6AB77|nr:hypothetical protein [Spongiactinospora sp. TRM90649]MDF5755338.1 hypothetical protein [Spongiactinospora sp. TRM90649]
MAPDQSSPSHLPPAWPEPSSQGEPGPGAQEHGRRGRRHAASPPSQAWDEDPLGPPHTAPAVPPPATTDVNYERTMAVPMRPRAEPGPQGPPGHQGPPVPPGPPPGPGGPPPRPRGDTPGGSLSRDPADPNRPFVTAGQISGPKTPPPERQQELWNTVFGDNYQAMGEDDEDNERSGRPVWIFALVGTVVVALVALLLWAFLAGPLAAETPQGTPNSQASVAPKRPTAPKKTLPRLPRYKGAASQPAGTVTDQAGAITLPRLGRPWRLDARPGVLAEFGYATRQFVPAGRDATGRALFAQVLSGPLPKRLAGKYSSPENLTPVVSAVAFQARSKYFAEGNTIAKTVHQSKSIGGMPAELIAYEITSAQTKTTMVVAAVSTGGDLPTVVFMMVPESKKRLMPDINTVFGNVRLINAS